MTQSQPASPQSKHHPQPAPSQSHVKPPAGGPVGGHPRGRIPALVTGEAWIASEKGALRPERALAYNRESLLLHDAAATRPGHTFTTAELAHFSKTSARILALTGRFAWVDLQPLEWTSPQELLFTTGEDRLFFDLVMLWELLEQIEALSIHTLEASTYLAFRRC